MSGKTLLILVLLVLAGLAVAAAVISLGKPPAALDPDGPGVVTKPEEREYRALPPLRDRPAVRTGEVAGRVTDPDGGPVAGATVTLSVERESEGSSRKIELQMVSGGVSSSVSFDLEGGPERVGEARSAEDGSFVFRTTEEGPFTVRADRAGFAAAVESKVERETRDLVLRLSPAGSIRGMVLDDHGASLPGAVVVTGMASTTTDEDGGFHLKDVNAASEVHLTARANGYGNASLDLDLKTNEERVLDEPLVLTGNPGLTGRVFDPTGEPLPGALARVASNVFGMVATGMTDEGGRYHLEEPGEGSISLSIRHVEYLEAEIEGIRFSKGERVIAPDIRLRPGGVISGRVVGPDGTPVKGAKARALEQGADIDFGALMMMGMGESDLPRTDAEGNFRVPGLSSGTYLLSITAAGYLPFTRKDVVVQVPETSTVEVELDPGLSLVGQVVDVAGQPLAGAKIAASPDEAPTGAENLQEMMLRGNRSVGAESGEDGTFVLVGLPQSSVSLTVTMDGYTTEHVEKTEPGADDLVITLRRTGSISGRVVDGESGEPVDGARVSADDGTSGSAETDEAGNFTLISVSPGTLTVTVSSDEHVPEEHPNVEVQAGSPTVGVEILLRRGETLTGVVVRASDGGVVAGANVSMDGAISRSVKTDQEGRFTAKGLVKGMYDLKATASEFAETFLSGVQVPSSGEVRIEMLMGGTIRGVVRDENGEPVSGQMVMSGSGVDMFGNMVTTDADGEFVFKNVPAGRMTLMVMKIQSGGGFGFGANTRQVEVKEGREVFVEFGGAGAPKRTRLKGRLLDHGRPAAGRMLIFMKADIEGGIAEMMANFKMVTTSADGEFDVADLEPGAYRVFSGAMGTDLGTSMDLDISQAGGVLEQDLVLPDGVFAGTVVRSDNGKPVSGAKLMLLDPKRAAAPASTLSDVLGLMKGQFVSGEEGEFNFDNAATGNVLLQVLAPDLAPAVYDSLTITDKPGQPLRIILDPGFDVKVRVIDGVGEPVARSQILVFDAQGRRLLVMEDSLSDTDSDGLVTLRLAPGTWRILAQPKGLAPAEKVVHVQGEMEITIPVSPGGTLLTVVTASGGPVSGAVVRTFDDTGREVALHVTQDAMMTGTPNRKTGPDGRHVRENVPVGTYRVTVTAPDGRTGESSVRIAEGGTTETAVEVK